MGWPIAEVNADAWRTPACGDQCAFAGYSDPFDRHDVIVHMDRSQGPTGYYAAVKIPDRMTIAEVEADPLELFAWRATLALALHDRTAVR